MKARALIPNRREAVALLASAVLFGIAFPPYPFVVPVFVCLVPVTIAVARAADEGGSWRDAALMGFWFGVVSSAINLYWLGSALALYTNLAFLGFAATLLGMGLIVGGFIAALFAARRATRLPLAILLPVVWVAKELFLDYLPDIAFPWLPLGLSMARVPLLSQAADLSGVHGLSFWLAAVNGLIVDAWLLRANRAAVARRAAAVVGLVAAVALYGSWRLSSITPREVAPIAVVQPNIPQEDKWQAENQQRIAGILTALAREVLSEPVLADGGSDGGSGDRPRLVVWPEAALPGFMVEHPEWDDSVRSVAAEYHTPIIFGVLDIVFAGTGAGGYEIYNAAMLADSTGRIGTQPPYHKTYLVPIVERVPFLDPDWFGELRYFGGLGRGAQPIPFDLAFGKVGVLICYESIFPQRSRFYRRAGASVLVNITNDAWFGRTIAPYQHESHLALRAIENRVGIVRAANTGISGYVDPFGRLHGATELFVPATRIYHAQTTDVRTLYVAVGDWLGMLSVLGTLLLLLAVALQRRGR